MKKSPWTYAVAFVFVWTFAYVYYRVGYEVAMHRVRHTVDMDKFVPKKVTISTPPGPNGAGKYHVLTTFRFCHQGEDPVEVRAAAGDRPVWRIQLDGGLTLYLD